jgi:hypothetical protein
MLLRQQQVRGLQFDQENAGARVILARNMNDQQVRDLAACMSQPERNVYATVQLDRSDAYRSTALASVTRFGENDQKEQSLAYQRPVQENEVMLRQKVVAANAPAAVGPATKPAESFALNIKPNEAGLTRGASDDAIRVNGTIAPNSTPSDFNFAEVNQQVRVPAQQQALFAAAPTTQPVLGRGTRDLYTCVIVVQNTSIARASGPATQPVAGKPATAPTGTPAAEPAK